MKLTARIFAWFLLLALVIPPAFLNAAEDPSLEDIAKTEAARLFLIKDFQGALHEFQKLEIQYPSSTLIKRYVASIYDALLERGKAIEKLNETLQIDSSDLIAHQMIGDIYIKQADFANAEQHFQAILSQNPSGAFGNYAQKRLEVIRSVKQSDVTTLGRKMSAQDFMTSEPAQLFAKARFAEALTGFLELEKQYPEDTLISRFIGITYMKLGKSKEAVEALKRTIEMDPQNAAAYFYLGQAYVSGKDLESAREAFRWVIENDKSSYNSRAQQAIFETLRGAGAASQKPWSVTASAGYNFDTNATFKSNDREYSTAGDKNTSKYSNVITGNYRFYQKGKWFFTADALYAQTIYHDFPHLNVYTPGGGVSALYAFKFFGKQSFLNFREGATMTMLKNKYYVWSNTLSGSWITNITDRYRATVTYRWGINEFDDNGTAPDITSRDGFSNSVGFLNTHYLNAEKTFYWTHGYDFEHHDTSGVNYRKNVNIGRIGLHKTLFEKVEGDILFSFKDANYYKFASLPLRRDDIYSLTFTLSRPLNKYLTLSGTYTFEDSRAKNNAYEYTRHDFGVKLGVKY